MVITTDSVVNPITVQFMRECPGIQDVMTFEAPIEEDMMSYEYETIADIIRLSEENNISFLVMW